MRGLYAITPAIASARRLHEMCAAALEGGAAILQYRNPRADAKMQLKQAAALAQLCRAFGALFVVNNHPRLAAQVGADGVHLGQNDMDLQAAREIVGPDAIIGATCHDSPQKARQAQKDGANYCAMGAFFPSPTKPDAIPCGLEKIAQAKHKCKLPIVAVGGINSQNITQVVRAGADSVAVVSALFAANDIRKAAQELSAAFSSSHPPTLPPASTPGP